MGRGYFACSTRLSFVYRPSTRRFVDILSAKMIVTCILNSQFGIKRFVAVVHSNNLKTAIRSIKNSQCFFNCCATQIFIRIIKSHFCLIGTYAPGMCETTILCMGLGL